MILINIYLLAGIIFVFLTRDDMHYFSQLGKAKLLWNISQEQLVKDGRKYMQDKYKENCNKIKILQRIFMPIAILYIIGYTFYILKK